MRVTARMCMQENLGVNGNLYGGNMMKWTDEAGAIYAHQITGEKRMVTFKFDEMIFRKPIKPGDIVEFFCTNPIAGHSSLSFHISAQVKAQVVFETNCVFVALDSNNKKKKIEAKIDPDE